MRPFEELTDAGKAGRLRAVAAGALERYDLRVRRVRLITNEFNAVFRVDGDAGRTFVLRVNLPNRRSLAEIEAEMSWLHALATETAIGVPTPIPANGGELVVTVSAAGVPEPRHCALFGWIGGIELAACLTEHNVAELGALTAQLHLHALTFDPPEGLRRWDNPFPLDDHHVLLDDGAVTPRHRATFTHALDRIEAALKRLSDEPPRMIHGDLHQDNVRVARGRLFAIDFDDSLLGYPVQDIGVTCWNLQDEPNCDALRRALRRGYERHASWPEQSPGDIDTFVADRALMLIDYALQTTTADEADDARAFIRKEVRTCADGSRGEGWLTHGRSGWASGGAVTERVLLDLRQLHTNATGANEDVVQLSRSFDNLVDLVCNPAVRLSVDGFRGCSIGRFDQAEHPRGRLVHPVPQVPDSIARLDLQVGRVCLSEVGG